jgi:hypothetical protein
VNSSKDRLIWAYYIGLTVIGKLICPNKGKKEPMEAKASTTTAATVMFIGGFPERKPLPK